MSLNSILIIFSLILNIFGQDVKVETPMGTVTGNHVNYNMDESNLWRGEADVFLGIPFAEPPIGDKRFQMPKPISEYPNRFVYANSFKPACAQPRNAQCEPQSEDCLYLNVFSPNVNSLIKYPVMIWIHGGSFTGGCAAQFPTKGLVSNLVSRGVLVVTIQYRLNIPGFFTTSTQDFPPNRGMIDQYQALKWVQDNIQYFGGNPYGVTVFGQSAGSISVSAHTYSPLSRGLFHQAIMQSGALFTSLEGSLGTLGLSQTRAHQLCNFTSEQWKSGDYSSLRSCMIGLDPSAWTEMDQGTLFGWRLLLDDYFLPDTPENLNKIRPKIPVLIGNMHDEFASTWYYQMAGGGIPFEAFSRSLVRNAYDQWGGIYGERKEDIWNVIINSYLRKGAMDNDSMAWWMDSCSFFTGASFTQFIVKEASMYREAGNERVYLYEQTFASNLTTSPQAEEVTKGLGGYRPVPHANELTYLWMYEGSWDKAIAENRTQPFDFILADWYGETWTTFARFGRPTIDMSWQPIESPTSLRHFNLGPSAKGGMMMRSGYRDLDNIVFTNIVTRLLSMTPTSEEVYDKEFMMKLGRASD